MSPLMWFVLVWLTAALAFVFGAMWHEHVSKKSKNGRIWWD